MARTIACLTTDRISKLGFATSPPKGRASSMFPR
jgi:hypothetical protein